MNPNVILVRESHLCFRMCLFFRHNFLLYRSWSLFFQPLMTFYWFWDQWLLDKMFLEDFYELFFFLLLARNLPLDLFYRTNHAVRWNVFDFKKYCGVLFIWCLEWNDVIYISDLLQSPSSIPTFPLWLSSKSYKLGLKLEYFDDQLGESDRVCINVPISDFKYVLNLLCKCVAKYTD